MPPEIIQYPYSKRSGYAAMGILIIFILLLLKTCISNWLAHDVAGTIVFGLFVLFVLFLLALMIITRLVPALKGEVALELDENGIKDHIRNIKLDWKDVNDIALRPGRSSSMLIFELKFDSDMGKQLFVSLRWVEGRDSDIFDTVLAYFDEVEGIVRED